MKSFFEYIRDVVIVITGIITCLYGVGCIALLALRDKIRKLFHKKEAKVNWINAD